MTVGRVLELVRPLFNSESTTLLRSVARPWQDHGPMGDEPPCPTGWLRGEETENGCRMFYRKHNGPLPPVHGIADS